MNNNVIATLNPNNSVYTTDKKFIESILNSTAVFFDSFDSVAKILDLDKMALIPDHFGTLIPILNSKKIEKKFNKYEFKVEKKFNSSIVSKQLIKKYKNEKISIKILKLVKNKYRLELFVCDEGMSKKQLMNEIDNNIHFAFSVNSTLIKKSFIKDLNKKGFKVTGGGINYEESVTVLYLRNLKTKIGSIKIELLISGIFPKLVEEFI